MSKVIITIDSDDDDAVEILECASVKIPVVVSNNKCTKDHRNQEVALQSNYSNSYELAKVFPPLDELLKDHQRYEPKPTTSSANLMNLETKPSVLTPLIKTTTASVKPFYQVKSTTNSNSTTKTTTTTTSTSSFSTTKLRQNLPQRSSSDYATSRMCNLSSNPIPAPVVIYSENTVTAEPENLLPLSSVNKMFQRDARTVALSKIANKHTSGLRKCLTTTKNLEIDSELAAIFAYSSSNNSNSNSHETASFSALDTSSNKKRSRSHSLLDSKQRSSSIQASTPAVLLSSNRQPSETKTIQTRESTLFSSKVMEPSSHQVTTPISRKRTIGSPQTPSPFSKPTNFNKKKVFYEIEDEDGEEENLELYINHVSSRRKLSHNNFEEVERPNTTGNKQCPLCYMMFPKHDIIQHSFDCNGKPNDKGFKKKTIGTAISLSTAERKKRRNAGIQDIGPINYYADSEDALALDGSGFGSEVTTGLNWESAGQTRFA